MCGFKVWFFLVCEYQHTWMRRIQRSRMLLDPFYIRESSNINGRPMGDSALSDFIGEAIYLFQRLISTCPLGEGGEIILLDPISL